MAVLWERSLVPWIDPNGDPYSGAKAYFFQPQTTTPMVTYTTSALDIPHDHPVIADGSGQFPPIFIPDQTIYRLRITTADDVTIWDVDGISSPTTSIPEPPTSNTPEERLWRTGDMKIAWRASVPSGFVRMNARTIGAATSGATERANADCENLFVHLWNEDPNLAVSGGRGASAAGDWAAGKTITLPTIRDYALVGMSGMGNSAAGIIPSSAIDGGNGDVLGAKAGEATHSLTEAENAAHSHSGSTLSAGGHTHSFVVAIANSVGAGDGLAPGPPSGSNRAYGTEMAGVHSHGLSINTSGTGQAHNNVQPSIFVPFFIKL